MSVGEIEIENQVDYITATCMALKADRGQSIKRFVAFGRLMVDMEETRGNDVSPWSMQSYVGWRSGSAQVGWVDDNAIIRLSGRAAADNWRKVYDDSTNVSRIDTALTVRLDGAWEDKSKTHLHEVRDYARAHMPKLQCRRIDGGKDGNSLMIGSRISDVYGRIYDKEAESREEFYSRCWRYEVEFKRDRARAEASRLASSVQAEPDYFGSGCLWMTARGVRMERLLIEDTSSAVRKSRTDDQRRIQWLATGVRGVVQTLVNNGRLADVIESLGLAEVVEPKP